MCSPLRASAPAVDIAASAMPAPMSAVPPLIWGRRSAAVSGRSLGAQRCALVQAGHRSRSPCFSSNRRQRESEC